MDIAVSKNTLITMFILAYIILLYLKKDFIKNLGKLMFRFMRIFLVRAPKQNSWLRH